MLISGWATVCDAGTTRNHHCLDVHFCLVGHPGRSIISMLTASRHPPPPPPLYPPWPLLNTHKLTSIKHQPSAQRLSPNAGSRLGQRRRRWPNLETALGQCFAFAGSANQCWFKIKLALQTVGWYCNNIESTLHFCWKCTHHWFKVGPASETVGWHWCSIGPKSDAVRDCWEMVIRMAAYSILHVAGREFG